MFEIFYRIGFQIIKNEQLIERITINYILKKKYRNK